MIYFKLTLTCILISLITIVKAQHDSIGINKAKVYFKQFDELRKSDNGKLWGAKLPSKMLFIDPKTYQFVANEPVEVYATQSEKGAYLGQYPKERAIANTSVIMDSTPWTMVVWPLNNSMDRALELMAHESYHSLQNLMNLKVNVMAIAHMEEKEARTLFRLEMNALYEALFNQNETAVLHALFFRKKRFEKYPKSKNEEILLETHEGLAQYTGYKLAYTHKHLIEKRIRENIEEMATKPSLSRATAYTSGPLYGLLLDASGKVWRKPATATLFNAFELIKEYYKIEDQTLNNQDFDDIKMDYKFKTINKEETARWKEREEKYQQYTKKLLANNPLIIELIDRQISFNPNSIIPFGEYGTIYEYFVLRDWFGVLTAKKGALMTNDWNHVRISRPLKINNDTIKGDGWTIILKTDCQIVKQNGKHVIKRTNDD